MLKFSRLSWPLTRTLAISKCIYQPKHIKYSFSSHSNYDSIPKCEHDGESLILGSLDSWTSSVQKHDNTNNASNMMSWEYWDEKCVCPFNNEAIKDIYKKEIDGSVEYVRAGANKILRGKRITTRDGKENNDLRKTVNPFFTLESMRYRFDVVINECNKLLDKLNSDNDYIRVYEPAKDMAFDVGNNAIFGDNLMDQHARNGLFENLMCWLNGWHDNNIENVSIPDSDLAKAIVAKDEFKNIMDKLLVKANEMYNNNTLDNKSLIYGLINETEFTHDENFSEIMMGIMFAAHETTCCMLCNLFCNFHEFPEETERLKIELQDIDDEQLDFDSVMNHKYLNCYTLEILRYKPSVRMINRRLTKDNEFFGYKLEKNTILTIPFAAMNYSENVWDKPNEFNPRRFYDNNKLPKKYEFTPFSMGSHKCLGENLAKMEIKTLITMLAKQCEIIDLKKHTDNSKNFVFYEDVSVNMNRRKK